MLVCRIINYHNEMWLLACTLKEKKAKSLRGKKKGGLLCHTCLCAAHPQHQSMRLSRIELSLFKRKLTRLNMLFVHMLHISEHCNRSAQMGLSCFFFFAGFLYEIDKLLHNKYVI